VNVLGEQLVPDPLTALSELVKNSYDADAEVVTITFSKKDDAIVIADDGHGMSLDDIRRGWLEIGSAIKRRRDRSLIKGRMLTGSMGIGRLAAFSLGHVIEAETGEEGYRWRSFVLNFRKITRARDLSKAKVAISTMPKKPRAHGTTITLSALTWYPKEFEELKRRLSALCSPKDISDFTIYLKRDDKTERIEPEEDLPASPISIFSRVDSRGHATTTIKASPALYEGSLAKTEWVFDHKGEAYPELSGVTMQSFWYPLGDRPAARYWKTALETKRVLADISGVRIYRDSVRVLPYGEKGDDWLGLEKRYVQAGPMSRRPRPSQLIGWLKISREKNPSLGDVANRQGLKETAGLQQLRKYSQTVFDCLAEVRREIEPIVATRKELSPEDKTEVDSALETVRNAISWSPALVERFSLIETAIESFFEQAELTALYRDRLTAGLLASIVMHDVGVPLNQATPMLMTAAAESCSNENHRRAFQILSGIVPKVNEGYLLLAGGLRPADYKVGRLEVTETVGATVAQMKAISESEKIRISLETKGVVTAKVRRSDIWAIITNFIANAIQCAAYTHARGRDFPPERDIVVTVEAVGSNLVIACEDNGPGLPDKPEGWIWEAYNTTKPNGSGLGLYIVSDIVAWYSGAKAATASTRFKSGALFRITLPGVVVSD
jgi:hypothetical protein